MTNPKPGDPDFIGPVQPPGWVDSTSDERIVNNNGNNVMRHEYRVLTDTEKRRMQAVKDFGLNLHEYLTSIGESREMSLAKTKLEECIMWATKAITK